MTATEFLKENNSSPENKKEQFLDLDMVLFLTNKDIFLYFFTKIMLWVLIRSASLRHF